MTPRENEQFSSILINSWIKEFTSAAESQQKDVLGHAYFQKIETFQGFFSLKQQVKLMNSTEGS